MTVGLELQTKSDTGANIKQGRLGDYVEILSGYAFDSSRFATDGEMPLIRIRDVVRGRTETFYSGPFDERFVVRRGDLLVGMDGDFNRETWSSEPALLNQRVCRISPRDAYLDGRYLYHFLPRALMEIWHTTPFATVKHLSVKAIREIALPLPPLEEQRRIAAILDKADELRTKRLQALAQLDVLAQSIFDAVFGDIREWQKVEFGELCRGDFRNGVSPSTRGLVRQRVLTLAAVTGETFDAGASKIGMFDRPTPVEQRVASSSFLLCRGNGNLNLVGRGHFPPTDRPDIVFPDTVIAANPDFSRVTRAFLGHVWNSPGIRSQLENRARTTNGTFKINQSMLGEILLPEPPMSRQNIFSEQVAVLDRLRPRHRAQLHELNALFASLQHRAFKGQL